MAVSDFPSMTRVPIPKDVYKNDPKRPVTTTLCAPSAILFIAFMILFDFCCSVDDGWI